MKQKVKVKILNNNISVPQIVPKGDWIDLRAAEQVELRGPYSKTSRKDVERKVIFSDTVIPLGIAMELPKGYEAVVNMRSSAFKYFNIILTNSQGVIDNTYNGDDDQWFAHVIPFADNVIPVGSRICQFRIQLSQKATFWQKLKWLLSNGIKIEVVDCLGNKNRGGHGSSGIK